MNQCMFCDRRLKSNKQLENHETKCELYSPFIQKEDDGTLKCTKCFRNFDSQRDIFIHMKLKHFLVRNLSEKGTVFCLSHNRVIFTFYSWRRNKMKMMWFSEHAASRAMHNLISRSAILIYKGWQVSRRNPNVCTWREFSSPLLRKMLFVETVTHNVFRIAAFDVYLYWEWSIQNIKFKIQIYETQYYVSSQLRLRLFVETATHDMHRLI